MRILNVTQSYSPFFEFGGPPVKVRALSEALARRGHEITVLTVDWGLKARLSSNAFNEGTQRSAFGWEREENGVRTVYLPTRIRYRSLSWNPQVKRFCRQRLRNFDVVHIFGLYDLLGPAVAAACRGERIPYVVEPIGMLIPIVRSFILKKLYHQAFGEAMLNGCTSLIATSEQEVEEIASVGFPREKIVLRRNGIEIPLVLPEAGRFRANQGISADVKLILFLGRLSEKKSPDLLLQAFIRVAQSLKDKRLMLVFAGPDEGKMKTRLAKMAAEFGLGADVKFCGALFGEEKWAAYRDADVFVLPSQNENFGNTAGEAIMAGTPVVVTDRCGIAPLLENVAGLVVPYRMESIGSAIESLLSEPGLHERLAGGCQEVASRLDWEEPAVEMENLYGRVVAKKNQLLDARR